MSLAARRHILLNWHYVFQIDSKMIDLDTLVTKRELGAEISAAQAYNSLLARKDHP
ncbi:hypothetical protein JOE11_003930 [Robbsia andropogonis]